MPIDPRKNQVSREARIENGPETPPLRASEGDGPVVDAGASSDDAEAGRPRQTPTGGADPLAPEPPTAFAAPDADHTLADIMAVLHRHTRHDFGHYRRATVLRRIERRLQVTAQPDLGAYAAFLKSHPGEAALLFQDLLISVTHFFRDQEAFEALENDVVAPLFADARPPEQPVRVWVVGCATGEEAYSVAILLREAAERQGNEVDFQVFATDIDERAIATARAGVYPAAIAGDIAAGRLQQFFTRDGEHFRVTRSIRERVLFATHNVLRDPPFSRLDLVCCRNLLIYLERHAQAGVLDMFRFTLRPHGALFLGSSESPEGAPEAFLPIHKKHRIFRAGPEARAGRLLPAPGAAATGDRHTSPTAATSSAGRAPSDAEIHRRALEQMLPPSVLVDANGDILHLSEGAGSFLEHGSGAPSAQLLANVSPELRLELRTALYAAAQSQEIVEVRDVRIDGIGRARSVNLSVRPFTSEAGARLALVVFEEGTVRPRAPASEPELISRQWIAQLELENRQLKEQLQSTIERSDIAGEEMKAFNEELQAINEELRSTTEELETSKEELQSTNEELVTVNHELKAKVEEADLINDDLLNFVAASDIATVFVNRRLDIMRFTPQAANLFNLIASDTGRPLMDITHRLDYPQMTDDALQAFDSLRVMERSVRATDGRLFLARFLPYRTSEDKISGAVLTFVDVSALHAAREQASANEQRLRLAAEATRDFAILTTDAAGLITAWNAGATRMFQWSEEEVLDRHVSIIYTDDDRMLGVPENEMRTALENGRAEDERWHRRKDGNIFYASGVTTPLTGRDERGFAKIARDTTELKQLSLTKELLLAQEQALRRQAQAASSLKDDFLAVMSHELRHPLNLIHVNAELLARMPEAQRIPAAARAGQAIQRAASSQSQIIDDLLDISRLRTGKTGLATSELALNQTVAAVVRAAVVDAHDRGVVLTFGCADEALLIEGDRQRLEQITRNLLANALRSTPAGGHVTVTLDRQPESAMVRLVVEDTGNGIEPELLPEVFEMFSPETASHRMQDRNLGPGLGLALVKELVVAHGGLVAADSEGVGCGSVFTVLLPAVAARLPAAGPIGGEGSLAGWRVLLMNAPGEPLDAFAAALRAEEAIVNIAEDEAAALKLLGMSSYDVLVVDLAVSPAAGHAFVRRLHTLGLRAPPFALALSDLNRDADVRKTLEAGFDAHLARPATIHGMKAAVGSRP